MIGSFRTRVREQPIIELHFEFKTVLKSYNLEARSWSAGVDPLQASITKQSSALCRLLLSSAEMFYEEVDQIVKTQISRQIDR